MVDVFKGSDELSTSVMGGSICSKLSLVVIDAELITVEADVEEAFAVAVCIGSVDSGKDVDNSDEGITCDDNGPEDVC